MEQRPRSIVVGAICLLVGVAIGFVALANPLHVGILSGEPQTLYRYNKWTGATWIQVKREIPLTRSEQAAENLREIGSVIVPIPPWPKVQYKWVKVKEPSIDAR